MDEANICCPAHDRLDLVRQGVEFTAPACGSTHRLNNKPDYCCFECPTLKVKLSH